MVGMTHTATGAFRARVAANMRAEIARADIPLDKLADALKMSDESIRRRKRGEIPWTLDELEVVADLAGIDPGEVTARK